MGLYFCYDPSQVGDEPEVRDLLTHKNNLLQAEVDLNRRERELQDKAVDLATQLLALEKEREATLNNTLTLLSKFFSLLKKGQQTEADKIKGETDKVREKFLELATKVNETSYELGLIRQEATDCRRNADLIRQEILFVSAEIERAGNSSQAQTDGAVQERILDSLKAEETRTIAVLVSQLTSWAEAVNKTIQNSLDKI